MNSLVSWLDDSVGKRCTFIVAYGSSPSHFAGKGRISKQTQNVYSISLKHSKESFEILDIDDVVGVELYSSSDDYACFSVHMSNQTLRTFSISLTN